MTKEFDIQDAADKVVTDYSFLLVIDKRKSAEGCGCNRCVNDYNDFILWLDRGRGALNHYLMAVGRGLASPEDDAGPPDFDSGNLAEWYSKKP